MRASTVLLLAWATACASPTAPAVEGQWGGPEASLVLTRSGGELHYPCGAGTVDSGWILSPDGRFTASGQHFFGGGPVPPQGRTPHPARYVGRVVANAFTLTVTVTDLNLTMGPLHMARGGPMTVEICV